MYDQRSMDVAKIIDRERVEKAETRLLVQQARASRPNTLNHLTLAVGKMLMALVLVLKVK